jgi:hypothetical protein
MEYNGDNNDGYPTADSGTVDPSIFSETDQGLLLLHYCANSEWDSIRDFLQNHSADEVREATESRDDANKNCMHFLCQNNPPLDIVLWLIQIAPELLQIPDSFSWLPLMYSTAYSCEFETIKTLAEAFPESKTMVDRRGRTALHFALGSNVASPELVMLLSNTGAAEIRDSGRMLPAHYAAAYGSSEEVLLILIDAYPEAINAKDNRNRTPLIFALSNAGRHSAPSAVRLLLSLNRDLVNAVDGGPLPLRVLSEYAATIKKDEEEQRESVESCLKHLLAAKPDPTADFFTALQSLPEFLQEKAVVMRAVQELLNVKIAQRFPTAILLMDFYMQIVVVVFYTLAVEESINTGFPASPGKVRLPYLICLYLGAVYFLGREIIQVISLISLKAWHIWLYGPSNWLNVIYIVLVFVWTGLMTMGIGDQDAFRYGTAWSFSFIWIKFLAYLRNISIDFAVFTGGVFHGTKNWTESLCPLFGIG